MAIYHLRASVISRSQGRSATASAAYRAAERIADLRTGLVFDYAARGGVDHAEILAPSHAPDWVHDRSELWNRVEAAETRKNSQVAREVRVALPAELSHDQRVELVRDFAQAQFVNRGMVADIALHAPGRAGDERNHHAHILLTTREVDAEGFTAKNRDWNKVEVLEGWREAWARDTNRALERADIVERVDHRTLVAQRDEARELAGAARDRGDEAEELVQTVRAVSLDRPPLPQLSPGAWQMKERGIEVGRVGAWHEARARAAEVLTLARDLAGQVRDWLEVRLDRVAARFPERDRLAAAGPAYEEGQALGRTGPERTEGRDGDRDDLAARLNTAWEAWQRGDADRGRDRAAEAEAARRAPAPETPDRDDDMPDLARRLERAASRMDPAQLARAAAALRESREADERAVAREAAEVREAERLRERERERELERERERVRERSRGLSWDR
ncbi:MobQ family relaxase [uncultured Jannaschia sp.]|uniref:MobQ family relaxase n=1 Tax=uncultured Jannaschia sp. TaxID=293347 RepID=UPI00261C27E6|nr:MobQ family relaxase [uncultured Jannaschia sp.]